jgi:hypothetical protein
LPLRESEKTQSKKITSISIHCKCESGNRKKKEQGGDLHGQLPGGGEDERVWVGGPHPPSLRLGGGWPPHDSADDGEAEGGGLPGPGLGARHEVPPGEGDGDGVALHGRGAHVLAAADVVVEPGAEVDLGEGGDGRRHFAAAGLDGDVLVRVEVDPRVLVVLERGRVGGRRGFGLREGVRLAVPGPPHAGPAPDAEAVAAAGRGAGEEAGRGTGGRGGGGGGAVAEVRRDVGGAGGAVGGRGRCGDDGGGRWEGLGVGDVGPGRARGGRRHGRGAADLSGGGGGWKVAYDADFFGGGGLVFGKKVVRWVEEGTDSCLVSLRSHARINEARW